MTRADAPIRPTRPIDPLDPSVSARVLVRPHCANRAATTARRLYATDYLLALTLGLALFGYQVSAPFIQLIALEGSAPAIILRGFIILLCGVCLMAYARSTRPVGYLLLPLYAFLTFYALRLIDNFYIREFTWHADPTVVFGLLLGAGVIPVITLARTVPRLDDRALLSTFIVLIMAFLVGLALNFEALVSHSEVFRASLDKLNPISLGAAAGSFALLLAITPSRTWLFTIARFALVTALVGITAFAESRGPIVGMGFALLVFGVAARGAHRKYLIGAAVAATVVVIAAPMIIGIDLAQMAFGRFFYESDNMDASAVGRVLAWQASWEQFLENPLIGDRVFEPTLMRYPHNLFLESLISVGLLGTYLLLIHLFISAKCCITLLGSTHSTILEKFVSLIFLKEFAQVQFSGAIWAHTTFWIASACVIALGTLRARMRSLQKQPGARQHVLMQPRELRSYQRL